MLVEISGVLLRALLVRAKHTQVRHKPDTAHLVELISEQAHRQRTAHPKAGNHATYLIETHNHNNNEILSQRDAKDWQDEPGHHHLQPRRNEESCEDELWRVRNKRELGKVPNQKDDRSDDHIGNRVTSVHFHGHLEKEIIGEQQTEGEKMVDVAAYEETDLTDTAAFPSCNMY